jgi:pimeloyl-ACP methyl ester carboxylesterase
MSKRIFIAFFISLFILLGAGVPTAKAEGIRNCQEVSLPVSITDSAPKDQTISATYCTSGSSTSAQPIDILVAGATYNRSYWDWPQNPDLYSYVNKTLSAGRATLAFDRLGTGKSSRISGGGLTQTVQVDASVLHQLVEWARSKGYTTVNAVGHSLGSVTVTKEAALYKDINKIVLTGILHFPAISTNAPNFATSLYPATLDPAFKNAGLDATYLTTLPNRRGSLFYDPTTADPNVISYDENHKDLATSGELVTSMAELQTPALLNSTKDITAPVFAVMGATDNIFCNFTVNCTSAAGISANEKQFYPNAASFDAASIPNTAHDLTLHPSADRSFATINDWLKS